MASLIEPATVTQLPYMVGHMVINLSISNPGYMHIFDFEKFDFVLVHQAGMRNIPLYIGIGIFYLISVLVLKKWMEGKEPFQLRRGLFLWNVLLSALSIVMFVRTLPELMYVTKTYGFYESYCKQDHLNMATAFWAIVYGLSKILEFGDTYFIILRKQPLTFLHTFHHMSIYMAVFWGWLLFDPASRYFMVMNCFVHMVMYAYFALKAAQVKLPRKLSMAVTGVQLLQFVSGITINCLSMYAVVMGTKPVCERPRELHVLYSALALVYFCLFANFFVDSYLRKDRKVK